MYAARCTLLPLITRYLFFLELINCGSASVWNTIRAQLVCRCYCDYTTAPSRDSFAVLGSTQKDMYELKCYTELHGSVYFAAAAAL